MKRFENEVMGTLGATEIAIVLVYFVIGILILPIIIGRYADSKGHSFALFVLISIILTPLLGFLIA